MIFFSYWRQGLFLERFSLTLFSVKKVTGAVSSCSSSSFCHFGTVDFIPLNCFSEIRSSEIIPSCFPCELFSYYSSVRFLLYSLLLSLMFMMDPSLAPCWCVRPQGFTDLSHRAQDLMWLWSALPCSPLLP